MSAALPPEAWRNGSPPPLEHNRWEPINLGPWMEAAMLTLRDDVARAHLAAQRQPDIAV